MIEFWAGTVLGVAIWSALNFLKEIWMMNRMAGDMAIAHMLRLEKEEKHDDDEGRD